MTPTDRKYLKLVEEWNTKDAGIVNEPIDYYTNWWQISWDEADQFKVVPSLNNALCLAYTRYQNMVGITDSGGLWNEKDAAADRKTYRLYLNDNCINAEGYIVWNSTVAVRFMSEVCKLHYQSCVGYLAFVDNAMDRAGLITHTIHATH